MCNLSIFFYDELNRDYSPLNAARIGEATLCGKLYLLPPNSPVLQTPTSSILWQGTKEIFADAQNQYMENDSGDFEFKIHEGWDVVHGELVMFSDPEDILPELDKLYGRPFYFDRVLVPVKKANGTITTAYVYTMDKIHMSARYLPDGIWVGATDSENNNLKGNDSNA
jgi:gamma-glutamylcyclotransferase (GGCT)/AIG2-like uncharacterized protein YtfP